MIAADHWREQLLARSIPTDILDRAPESPYGYPRELFRCRAERSEASRSSTPATRRASEAIPQDGTVIDVGCGAGATSLPLLGRAGRLIGVDEQRDMLDVFRQAVAARVNLETFLGRWPAVADAVPMGDVVVCGHVLYNVPDAAPFVAALRHHARRRVVIELTDSHPIQWMAHLWHRFHGLRWPDGPTADDAVRVIEEMGYPVRREDRVDRHDRHRAGFERREDAVALVRRRLCLSADRDHEVEDALGPMLHEAGGRWSAGPRQQTVVTLWWDVSGDR